jgi:selenocysteine-specific elongation factor
MTNLSDKALENLLQHLLSKKKIIQTDKESRIFIHQSNFEKLRQETAQFLRHYHTINPLKAGMPKEELKSKFPSTSDSKLFNLVLNQMINDREIVQEENTIRLQDHRVQLVEEQADIRDRILGIYHQGGLQPPYFREVSKTLGVEPRRARDVLQLLVDEELIVRTKEDLYFDAEAIHKLKQTLVAYLESKGEITTPQFKDMTGASRKFVIPLIEYFDSKNVTLRVGDVRKLRRG